MHCHRAGGLAARVVATIFVVSGALLSGACAGPAPRPLLPSSGLPVYQGREVELFDDGLGAQLVGMNLEPGASPKEHALLRDRTREGDCVVRARVVTVASGEDESGPRWFISFHTTERLAGERDLPDDFTLRMDARSPGAGAIRTLERQLVGAQLVAFLREFAPAEGGGNGSAGELHFHLGGDAKEEIDSVHVAAVEVAPGP